MKPGDVVYPRTKAGLQLASKPIDLKNGSHVIGELHGEGTVLDIKMVKVHFEDDGVSLDVDYQNCFILTNDGHIGWAGAGALVKTKEEQLG